MDPTARPTLPGTGVSRSDTKQRDRGFPDKERDSREKPERDERSARLSPAARLSTKTSGITELPAEVLDDVAKAMPGQVQDFLRVVRAGCAALDPERARRVTLIASRKLRDRSERSELTNPAGLLRACLIPEALNDEKAITEACSRLRDNISRADQQLVRARNGNGVLLAMRKRALDVPSYVAQHKASFGCEPDDVPRPCADDPEFSEILAEVEELQELVRAARERSDAAEANRAEEKLHRLERRLDQFTQRRRGQVS